MYISNIFPDPFGQMATHIHLQGQTLCRRGRQGPPRERTYGHVGLRKADQSRTHQARPVRTLTGAKGDHAMPEQQLQGPKQNPGPLSPTLPPCFPCSNAGGGSKQNAGHHGQVMRDSAIRSRGLRRPGGTLCAPGLRARPGARGGVGAPSRSLGVCVDVGFHSVFGWSCWPW